MIRRGRRISKRQAHADKARRIPGERSLVYPIPFINNFVYHGFLFTIFVTVIPTLGYREQGLDIHNSFIFEMFFEGQTEQWTPYRSVILDVDEDGQIRLEGRSVRQQTLRAVVEARLVQLQRYSVVINAHPHTDLEHTVFAFDQTRMAGASVTIVSDERCPKIVEIYASTALSPRQTTFMRLGSKSYLYNPPFRFTCAPVSGDDAAGSS